MVDLRNARGERIETWEQWERPKKEAHWKPQRSAMELARSWFRNGEAEVPDELRSAFAAHPKLRELVVQHGRPEKVTSLPERGEGRNHDLLLDCALGGGTALVSIEAKADEPFGDGSTVIEYWHKARAKRDAGKSTRVPERIEAILEVVAGRPVLPQDSLWKDVPYQLLAATAGLHFEIASRTDPRAAVLIVHELHSPALVPLKLQRNREAFDVFLSALLSQKAESTPGRIYGPFRIRGCLFYVGKVVGDAAEPQPN